MKYILTRSNPQKYILSSITWVAVDGDPSNVVASTSDQITIKIDWSIGSTNHLGHRIYRSFDGINYTLIGTVTGSVSTYNDTVSEYKRYYYRICAYNEYLISGYVYSNSIVPSPLIIDDGHTIARFNVNDIDSVTFDISSRISSILDNIGATITVSQSTDSKKPILTKGGYYFHTSAPRLKSSSIASLDQPTTIYLVLKQISWTANYQFIDGNTNASGTIRQFGTTPNISVTAGADSSASDKLPINQWGIIRVIFDGANGVFQIDDNDAITGNFGSNNMLGITLGGMGQTDIRHANFMLADIIFRDIHDTTDNYNNIYNYLKSLHDDKVDYDPMVWTKYGVVIEGDEDYENNAVQETCVMYTTTDSIIVGNPCFQIWYSCESGGLATRSIGYAESKDAITWVKYEDNPILTSMYRGDIIKYNNTYYLYNQAGSLYTSPDPVNFTFVKANAIAPPTGYGLANKYIYIEDGTWYCYYEAAETATALYHICLATSNDGETWTNNVTNPIIKNLAGSVSGPFVYKDTDGGYHMWTHNAYGGNVPTDGAKYYSADGLTWYFENYFEFPRIDADEGAGNIQGQVADFYLIEVNSETYLFYEASPDQTTLVFKIKMAKCSDTLDNVARSISNTIENI